LTPGCHHPLNGFTLRPGEKSFSLPPVKISLISFWWRTAWTFLAALPEPQVRWATRVLWGFLAVLLFTIVAVDPMGRSATREYRNASTRWWQGTESLYKGKNKFLYLPQAAIIYTPFNLLPRRLGEPLWRMACLATLAASLWAAARLIAPKKAQAVFLVTTLLMLPSSLASARNGQVNLPLAGLYLLTAVMLARNRWHPAAILLALALALKPISIVPILLCGVLYPRLLLPLALWLSVMLGSAFLHPDPQFVLGQYEAFFQKLTNSAAKPTGHSWCDFSGMLKTFGLPLSDTVSFLIRTGAAALTLGVCLFAKRIRDPTSQVLTIMLFAVSYLMLFNPRTETNSYIILGVWIGLLGAYEGLVRKNFKTAALWVIFALILGTENYGWPIFPLTNLWLKALVTLALAVWLSWRVIRTSGGEAVIFLPPSPPESNSGR
jgi:alpha-1,2-mannosyltransferase